MQQCGTGAPGIMGETVLGLLKVTNSFGVIAFGFACRDIYVTSQSSSASPHLICIESFIIINFLFSLFLGNATAHGKWVWDSQNTAGKGGKAAIFGVLHVIFGIVLFGLIAGILQHVTGNDGKTEPAGLNAAGSWMVLFGLLFSVMQFFTGTTMLMHGKSTLNSSAAGVTNKVALAFGALAFGFACRHINLGVRATPDGADTMSLQVVHTTESFIIINFFLTLLIDFLHNIGKIEY